MRSTEQLRADAIRQLEEKRDNLRKKGCFAIPSDIGSKNPSKLARWWARLRGCQIYYEPHACVNIDLEMLQKADRINAKIGQLENGADPRMILMDILSEE